ncbi:MAG: hypothetical protein WA996_01360 [Candidatus Promineifilaceae bacterium]
MTDEYIPQVMNIHEVAEITREWLRLPFTALPSKGRYYAARSARLGVFVKRLSIVSLIA